MNEEERVREEIIQKVYSADLDIQNSIWLAKQILSLPNIAVLADNQGLPDNEVWHKVEGQFEAYCAGKNEMLKDKWKRIVKNEKDTTKKG